jgi:hypothetical protein
MELPHLDGADWIFSTSNTRLGPRHLINRKPLKGLILPRREAKSCAMSTDLTHPGGTHV